MPYPPA